MDVRSSGPGYSPGIDASPAVNRLRRRALIIISLGELLDGYDIVVISGALILIRPQFHLPASLTGLLGASVFLGAFVGMVVLGDLSDRLGRRQIFVFNLIAFVGLAILSALVANVTELIIIRFLIGVAVGADVPTSMAFLNELAPRQTRGAWGGALPNIMWGVGAAISALIWLPLLGTGGNVWRWAFGLAAVPALAIWIARQSLPESPRWLIAHGRRAEAEDVLRSFGVEDEHLAEDVSSPQPRRYRELFGRSYGPRLAAVCVLVICNGFSGPVTTVATPYILRYVGLLSVKDSLLFSGLIWLASLAGAMSAWHLLDRFDRRVLVYSTQAVNAVLVVVIAFVGRSDVPLMIGAFFIFAYLQWAAAIPAMWLWGTELFPTRVRAAGQGITNGVNRLAIAGTTVFITTALTSLGFTSIMVIFALLTAAFAGTVLAFRPFASNKRALEELSP